VPTAPIAQLPANTEDLDPQLFPMYEQAKEHHRAGRFDEAVHGFAAVARLNPRFSGALGMVVASLAPSNPDAAKVAALAQAADAAPGDALAQFMAGVAAHYSAHYTAETREQKLALYRQTIAYLEKARAAYAFEPRIYIYLAVSHYRLGEQAEAEGFIERAVELDANDPDAYYCRAEIWHRKDPAKAIGDLDRYLEMSALLAEPGSKVAEAKVDRVKALREHLQKVASGEGQPEEVFDPLEGPAPPPKDPPVQGAVATALGSSPVYAWIVLGVALLAAAGVFVLRRRRRGPQQ
jgi:LPXTG-motif cell wall-anchored protein